MKRQSLYFAILLLPLLGGVASKLLRVIVAFSLRSVGVSVFDITLLFSSFMLSRALFSPIMGRWADRGFKRHLIIGIGFAGLLIDSQLYLHVSYYGILTLRVLDGIFSAMVWPTMQAIVHFSSPDKLKARIMSMYFIMGSIGMSLGYVIYSYLVGDVFYGLVLIALVYSVEISMVYFVKDVDNSFSDMGKKSRRSTVKKRNIGIPLLGMTFMFGMYLSLGNEVLLFYLAENMGFGKVDATRLLFFGVMIAMLGSILFGHIADKKGFLRSLLFLGIITPISALLISFDSAYLVVAGVFLFFISGRGFTPISRSFTASFGKDVGTSLGFVNLASNFGSMTGPLLGGYLMDFFGTKKFYFFNMAAITYLIIGTGVSLSIMVFFRSQARAISQT